MLLKCGLVKRENDDGKFEMKLNTGVFLPGKDHNGIKGFPG